MANVLALDLERTLISDALLAIPRPGLSEFLAYCHERFERVVLFTTVEEADALAVLEGLADAGVVPIALLERLEYIPWEGEHKDVRLVPETVPEEVLFVDDDSGWILPEQRDRWVPIRPWDGDDVSDRELARVKGVLGSRSREVC